MWVFLPLPPPKKNQCWKFRACKYVTIICVLDGRNRDGESKKILQKVMGSGQEQRIFKVSHIAELLLIDACFLENWLELNLGFQILLAFFSLDPILLYSTTLQPLGLIVSTYDSNACHFVQ